MVAVRCWTSLCLCPAMAMACPLCKEALFEAGHIQQRLSMARGYALSIGVLLLVPFGLIAGVTAAVVRAARRRSRGVRPRSAQSPTVELEV